MGATGVGVGGTGVAVGGTDVAVGATVGGTAVGGTDVAIGAAAGACVAAPLQPANAKARITSKTNTDLGMVFSSDGMC